MAKKQYFMSDGSFAKKLPFFHPRSRRFHLVLLIMSGLFSLSLVRMNLGMSMTCMVNSTALTLRALEAKQEFALNSTLIPETEDTLKKLIPETRQECARVDHGKKKTVNDYGGTFMWDASTQGYIFAAGFYGSLLTVIPSGLMADAWSPVQMLKISAIAMLATNTLVPFFAENFGPWSVFGLRFFMGLFEGIILPSVNKLASQWIPNEEKSTAVSMYTSGNQFGGIIGIPFFAFLCSSDMRWPAIFYSSSLMAFVWLCLWHLLVKETPAKCKNMSERERVYLESFPELKSSKKNRRFSIPPLKAILTSAPFLSLIIVSIATNSVATIVQIYLPTFMKEVLYLSPVYNGFFSAAPPFIQFFGKMSWSIMIDRFKSKGLSPTKAVRISQAICNFGTAFFFLVIAFTTDCSTPYLTLLCLSLMGLCFSTSSSGFFTSVVSLAPSYTGIITSLTFVFGTAGRSLPSFFVPYFNKTGTPQEWRNVFILFSSMLIVSGIIFSLFGSGVPQDWGIEKTDETTEKKQLEEGEIKSKLSAAAASEMGSMMLDTID